MTTPTPAVGHVAATAKAIEQQVKDQQEVTRQQAELLKVQSGQLELQRQQFADQISEQRRAQASRVFIWTETGTDPRITEEQAAKGVPIRGAVTVHIRNTSEQPIYKVFISWQKEKYVWDPDPHSDSGWQKGTFTWNPPDEPILVLMPGNQEDRSRAIPDDEVGTVFRAIAFFTDAAGSWWRVDPRGQLEEISEPPAQ